MTQHCHYSLSPVMFRTLYIELEVIGKTPHLYLHLHRMSMGRVRFGVGQGMIDPAQLRLDPTDLLLRMSLVQQLRVEL